MVRSEPAQPVANTTLSDDILAGVGHLLWLMIRTAIHLAWWCLLFPMLSVPAAAAMYLGIVAGWPSGVGLGLTAGLGLLAWRLFARESFKRCVSGRIWKRRRRFRVYRKPWPHLLALHGLTTTLNANVVVPRLRKTRIGYAADELLVRLIPGQTVADWAGQSDAFAHSFGANTVNVTAAGPGWVRITVHHTDSLTAPIRVPSPSNPVNLAGVPVGATETGTPWLVRVLGRHLLIAGATGSGKGSVVWSILTGLSPLIRDGVVQAWVIDPKGGMEFGRGTVLFARFAYDTTEQTLVLLRDAARILTERAERLRGVTRQHVPTVQEPLILIVIDELASLTAYQTDRKIAAETSQLLGLILSQGRAVGLSVIGCVQDPSKEVIAFRQLFPTRIGLRLTEPSQVPMILGAGARERGALCDLISDRLPGVGYVTEDGTTHISRVRAFHVTDTDIDSLGSRYAPQAVDPGNDAEPGSGL